MLNVDSQLITMLLVIPVLGCHFLYRFTQKIFFIILQVILVILQLIAFFNL